MKKTLPLFALFVLTSLQVSAQEGSRYRFDNFDTREGVRVVVPAQAKPSRQSRRLRLTARTAERGAASMPASNKTSGAPRPSEASQAVYTPTPSAGGGGRQFARRVLDGRRER